MKRLKYILPILFFATMIGCKKDLDSEVVSSITHYAVFKMAGDPVESVIVGTPYTDPGVTAYENGVEIPHTTTGSVDPNTPGGYVITYTAVNKDGYTSSAIRIVGVITSDVLTDDFTGSYKRNAGANGVAKWTKVKDGIYLNSDVGGADVDGSVYVVNIKKNIVVVPHQPFAGSGSDTYCENVDGKSLEIPFTFGPIGTICYQWIVINSGYGAGPRQFVRIK